MMTTQTKQRKYNYLTVIQQAYPGAYGWEDVSEYEQPKTKQAREAIRNDVKEYQRLGYPTRVIKRRELAVV